MICYVSDKGNFCANEGDTCHCMGMVLYGKDGIWTAEREVRRSIECNNKEFGDPLPGTRKECRCRYFYVA